AGGERRASSRDSEQRRSAGAVDRVAAALQIEVVADSSGDGIREPTRQRLFVGRSERRLVPSFERAQELTAALLGPAFLGERRLDHPADEWPTKAQAARAREFPREGIADEHAGRVARQALALGVTRVRE